LEKIFNRDVLSPIQKKLASSEDNEFYIKTISTCQTHSFFLSKDGKVFCCGLDKGQLGLPYKSFLSKKCLSKNCKVIELIPSLSKPRPN
jgi:alpha-tubulin suppressor-like RCC1 family protein